MVFANAALGYDSNTIRQRPPLEGNIVERFHSSALAKLDWQVHWRLRKCNARTGQDAFILQVRVWASAGLVAKTLVMEQTQYGS